MDESTKCDEALAELWRHLSRPSQGEAPSHSHPPVDPKLAELVVTYQCCIIDEQEVVL